MIDVAISILKSFKTSATKIIDDSDSKIFLFEGWHLKCESS